MPNWCSNQVTYYSENADNVAKILHAYNDVCSIVGPTYCSIRMEDLAWALDPKAQNKYNTPLSIIFNRCFIAFCDGLVHKNDGRYHISFDIETAWGPSDEAFHCIAELSGTKCVYIAEEPGCDVYINTDWNGEFYTEKYLFEDAVCDAREYFEASKELATYIKSVYGITIPDCYIHNLTYITEHVRQAAKEDYGDEYFEHCINIHEFEYE